MRPLHLPVRRGRVTDLVEYFRVGSQKLVTVRRVRRTGELACLTHRGSACEHIEAVAKYLMRGRVARFERRPA
jgi:hypothetical protein